MIPRVRFHGPPPYRHAVVHGGPGAPGMLGALAATLATGDCGLLEPLQSASSIDSQVDELAGTLRGFDKGPWTLIGSSWGGMLTVFTAQRYPELIGRAVLVGCAPFDAEGGRRTAEARRARMAPELRDELDRLEDAWRGTDPQAATAAFARSAALLLRVDHLDPVADQLDVLAHQREVFTAVWDEVEQRRSAGSLLDAQRPLRCPVIVLHGSYDPHPLAGVVDPLRALAADLDVHVLERCGHLPWIERHARERFLQLLREVADLPVG